MRIVISKIGLLAVAAAAVTAMPPAGNAAEEPAAPPVPRAGCTTFTDDKGDAAVAGQKDADLDILDVVLASPPGKVRAYIHVDELGTPAVAPGHRFNLTFQLEGKNVSLFSGGYSPAPIGTVHSLGSGIAFGAISGVSYDGVTVKDAKVDAVWDTKASTVILTTDRAPIEAAAKKPLADGVVVTKVSANSLADFLYSTLPADTAAAKTPETQVYTVGDNACFAPPEGRLTLQVPASVVAGHVATVTGTLSTATGTAVGGKTVTVTFAGKTVQATSGADGAIKADFPVASTAGSYPVTATWAGDDALGTATATAPIVVKIQPTTTTLTSAVSGTSVIVKATLLDDLKKPLAGQTVTWLVDGKAAGSTKTDAAGRASLKTVKGKTVKATFAGVRNRYAASTASRRT